MVWLKSGVVSINRTVQSPEHGYRMSVELYETA